MAQNPVVTITMENGDYSIEMTAEDDYIDSMHFRTRNYMSELLVWTVRHLQRILLTGFRAGLCDHCAWERILPMVAVL